MISRRKFLQLGLGGSASLLIGSLLSRPSESRGCWFGHSEYGFVPVNAPKLIKNPIQELFDWVPFKNRRCINNENWTVPIFTVEASGLTIEDTDSHMQNLLNKLAKDLLLAAAKYNVDNIDVGFGHDSVGVFSHNGHMLIVDLLRCKENCHIIEYSNGSLECNDDDVIRYRSIREVGMVILDNSVVQCEKLRC